MLSIEIQLYNHPHLRLLQFNLHLEDEGVRKLQDDVIQWFHSTCRSVTSKSLVVEVKGFSEELDACSKIQDILLALHARMERFSLYLSEVHQGELKAGKKEGIKKLFSRLCEAGVVIEKDLSEIESVSYYFLIFKLVPCLVYTCLACLGF